MKYEIPASGETIDVTIDGEKRTLHVIDPSAVTWFLDGVGLEGEPALPIPTTEEVRSDYAAGKHEIDLTSWELSEALFDAWYDLERERWIEEYRDGVN